jgi:hypothetical protein
MVRSHIEKLTPREREVLELVIRGKNICSRRSDEAAPRGGAERDIASSNARTVVARRWA